MSAKICGTHRSAFLKTLAETGNVMLAADQVRVSKDWAYKLQRELREALRLAREGLKVKRWRGVHEPLTPPAADIPSTLARL